MKNSTLPVLYITYDGLTDPLGRSQVLPYLEWINQFYPDMIILSAEKPEAFRKNEAVVRKRLEKTTIHWEYITYHRSPPVLSTLSDITALKKKAADICKKGPVIVHCRSYVAALIGLHLKRKYNCRFIFDMRGFWADERIEGGIWNMKNPLFRMIYRYFKSKEKAFFDEADAVISLTERARPEIGKISPQAAGKIAVIPCCADRQLFNPASADNKKTESLRKQLNISAGDMIVTYLGSVGTWYLLPEMLKCFKKIKEKHPHARLLFITTDAPEMIRSASRQENIEENSLIITSATREEVPVMLRISSVGLFFIRQCFSKLASSPTKMGEFLSMGIPVITNDGVGDVGSIVEETGCGMAISEFSDENYTAIAEKIPSLIHTNPEIMISAAAKYFDLESGVKTYLEVYNKW